MSDLLKVPPHDIGAEQSVLGALMRDPDARAKIGDWFDEAYFYRKAHRVLYRAINELAERNIECDAITMGDWLRENQLVDMVGDEEGDGVNYVLRIASNTPSAANIVAYAEIVQEKALLRAAADIGTRLVTKALEGGAAARDAIGAAAHELTTISASTARGGLQSPRKALQRHFAELNHRYENPGNGLVGIPTPWHDINKLTKGLRPGVLYLVGARPSMGKSVFGSQLAGFAALHDISTAVFTIEMTADEWMGRTISCFGEIPFSWLDEPTQGGDSEIYCARYSNYVGQFSQKPLVIDDQAGIGIDHIVARAKREHLHRPLRLIVIDHLHDLALDRSQEMRHELGRAMQGAKNLAKALGASVVMLCQLNRNVGGRQDKRPTMLDLRESGELEQKADVVLFLHREDYYDANSHMAGTVEVIPAKGRNLKLGKTILLQNRFDEMRLDDWFGAWPEAPPKPDRQRNRGLR